jgi:ABC-type branched-subunit amino acid transport system substrate-binding protein
VVPGPPSGPTSSAPATTLPDLERARALLSEGKAREASAILASLATRGVPSAARPGLHALAALAHQRLGEREAARRQLEAMLRLGGLRAGERAWAEALRGVLSGHKDAPRPAVGLLVPRSGRYRSVGEELRAGVLAGAGAFEAGGPLRLLVADSAPGTLAAARRLLDEGAQALIGGVTAEESEQLAPLAAARSLPFVAVVCPRAPGATTLCIVPTSEQRARAAVELGLAGLSSKRVAWLAPDSGFGRSLTAELEAAARERGATVVARVRYSVATSAFTVQARTIVAASPDLIFVPDTARALSLIAPALAGVGLWPTAGQPGPRASAQRGRRERSVRLVATADGLTPALLASAGRYLEGALLAPGFASQEPPSSLEQRVRRLLGHTPSALEAFAHDAAWILAEGARRAAFAPPALRSLAGLRGLTGAMRFGNEGRRSDPARIYRLQGGQLRAAE